MEAERWTRFEVGLAAVLLAAEAAWLVVLYQLLSPLVRWVVAP